MSWLRPVVALAAATFALGARGRVHDVSIPATSETATPLQLGLREVFAERQAAGLPVPKSVQFTYEVTEGAPPAAGRAQVRSLSAAEAGRTVTITGRSVVTFETPEQAGYDYEWPRLDLRGTVLPGAPAGFLDGDYTEAYRAYAEQQVPGVWDQVQFGREPRTVTVRETITITFPEGSTAGSALVRALKAETLYSGATVEQILLGFTYDGPYIDKTTEVNVDFTICLPWPFDDYCWTIPIFEFKAGFELWWAFGLRLPAEAAMSGPIELTSSPSPPKPTFYTDLSGKDWSADEYALASVDAPSPGGHVGNEFVFDAHFWAGVKFLLFGQDPCLAVLHVPCYLELDVSDVSTSFATPFGTGAFFPITPADVPIYNVGIENTVYFELGLRLTPLLGSSRITAEALVSGAPVRGGGPLQYTEPGVPVAIDVAACISKGEPRDASVEVRDFRYWFNNFLVKLGAYGRVDIMGYSVDPTLDIYTVDLSRIFDDTLSVGSHVKCDAGFHCSRAGPDNVLALAAQVVDREPPVTSRAIAGAAGKDDWYRSDLVVTLSALDEPAGCDSGVAATEYWLAGVQNAYTAPFAVTIEGITPFSYASRDADGMTETQQAFPLKIDKTPPSISGRTATSPNDHGWFGNDVTVVFQATDVPSGLDTVSPNLTLTREGAGQSVTGSAQDLAGNSASTTVSGIHIDKTPPTLEVTSPRPVAYRNTATFPLAWNAHDTVSGIAHELGEVDGVLVPNGQSVPLLLFTPSQHVAYVLVEDMADHLADASVAFEVTVDLPGLLAAQEGLCGQDWINKYGICHSLEAKLLAALASTRRGNLVPAANQLRAYLHELDAQWNKAVSPRAYELLRVDVQYVLAHLE